MTQDSEQRFNCKYFRGYFVPDTEGYCKLKPEDGEGCNFECSDYEE